MIYTSSSNSSNNNSSSSSSNNSSSISSTSSNNRKGNNNTFEDTSERTVTNNSSYTDADSTPLNSKGLITYIRVLLKQAAILQHKEKAEEEVVYKAEIVIYKARKHALPISLAVKKAALAAMHTQHCFLELRSNLAIKAKYNSAKCALALVDKKKLMAIAAIGKAINVLLL
ncbi:hypothetical protein P8C59_000946 [Phyllachora maydis]|uniref:Uncharacterized protein n=1 Tax=Phyllachora maydis TaxID=1825666 RepID=A0AAD9M8D7_9PEZI|nr:hypothetical protein P8C59_000946 [Phyllachora maydis]